MSNPSFEAQTKYLERVINESPVMRDVLERAGELSLQDWYLGAGAVAQTVWNDLHRYDPIYGIKDIDIVYFDPNISAEAQSHHAKRAESVFSDLPLAVEVTNEARVHLWYEEEYGTAIPPYISTEEAISTWPTTAASIGVRHEGNQFNVYAPFGLHDLVNLIVRPNKVMVPKEVYVGKSQQWKSRWPLLQIIPWDIEPSTRMSMK